ncbi:hypothetical protein [Bradyrhizobium pachyrhizi]|uniref:hypothetical protein n=1 Tax=Bradyrhizobium pachyrhizi TaxID=280333 RepID=UPI000B16736A|nr:hypothetical protein [Bradyrhizobium pachyrhizi]
MLGDETAAVLRAVLDEVCGDVPRPNTARRTSVYNNRKGKSRIACVSVAHGMSGLCSTRYVRQFSYPLERHVMRRTEALQRVRIIKSLDILGRYEALESNQLKAAEPLGVGERTFRRWISTKR